MLFFFFFKQKTAYEMRISDWSSDVCSSDLGDRTHLVRCWPLARPHPRRCPLGRLFEGFSADGRFRRSDAATARQGDGDRHRRPGRTARRARAHGRSEEHTSELQSLMRTSYAVFCLKKKNTKNLNSHNSQ